MPNIVELREKLTFGKYKDCTGAELLKSPHGTQYLAWLYKNTDVQMDSFVVDSLVAAKLVTRKFERRNSKAGGGVELKNDIPHFRTIEIKPGGNLEGVQPFKLVPLSEGRARCKELRGMILQDKMGSVDEMFKAAIRAQMRSLSKDLPI